MKLLTAAALALSFTLGFSAEADAQFSRKDYPQDRDRTTASTRTPERTTSRDRATTRERTTNRERTAPRERTTVRRTETRRTPPRRTPPRTTVACPPPRVITTRAPRRATRVVYRDSGPARFGSAYLSRSERRAYQRRLTARAERLAKWEVELVERRGGFVSSRERRDIAAHYFPYSTTGTMRANELEQWNYFLEDEAVALSRREESLRERRDRRRGRDNRGSRSDDYCPPRW